MDALCVGRRKRSPDIVYPRVKHGLIAAGFEPVWDGFTFFNPETMHAVTLAPLDVHSRVPGRGIPRDLPKRMNAALLGDPAALFEGSGGVVLWYRGKQEWSRDNGVLAVAVYELSGARISPGPGVRELDGDAQALLAQLWPAPC